MKGKSMDFMKCDRELVHLQNNMYVHSTAVKGTVCFEVYCNVELGFKIFNGGSCYMNEDHNRDIKFSDRSLQYAEDGMLLNSRGFGFVSGPRLEIRDLQNREIAVYRLLTCDMLYVVQIDKNIIVINANEIDENNHDNQQGVQVVYDVIKGAKLKFLKYGKPYNYDDVVIKCIKGYGKVKTPCMLYGNYKEKLGDEAGNRTGNFLEVLGTKINWYYENVFVKSFDNNSTSWVVVDCDTSYTDMLGHLSINKHDNLNKRFTPSISDIDGWGVFCVNIVENKLVFSTLAGEVSVRTPVKRAAVKVGGSTVNVFRAPVPKSRGKALWVYADHHHNIILWTVELPIDSKKYDIVNRYESYLAAVESGNFDVINV